ncbi:MAG: protein kinase [Polyangiaceae bacterium]
MARPGDLVAGRFELEAEVAAGPQGTVYRARDRARNLVVALKIGTSAGAQRTAREAAALGALSHPNIVRLEAHGALADGASFVAMEWLEGSTLAAHLEAAGTLSVAETLQLGSALGAALAHVHARGFVHRDVKPANVLITTDHRVHLVDFGVAVRRSETLRLTLPGGLVGTPAYMAPDLARAEGELDGRADVYSLGCVLYECLTGAPPFHGEHAFAVLAKVIVDEVAPIASKRDDVPGPVAAWIERMLRKSRSERPDAETVVAALHALAERGSARGDTVRPTADAAPAERRVLSVVLTAPVDAGGATLTAIEADRSVARTTELARARGGVVDQLATGSFVAVFGGRGASSDHANRAAGYALDLVALGETHRAAVVTARAEDERRARESLIDRAMELLLDARDPKPGVLADGSTSALLDGRFVVTPRWADGARLTRRPAGDSEPRRLLGKTTPFVGREAELNELLEVVATCCTTRRARSALLVAEAGMGKSRLAVEVVAESLVPRDARTRGIRWLHGRGESAAAFSLMGNLVRSAIGATIGDALDTARKKLDARLGVGPHAELLGEIAQVPTARESDALAAARTDPALMGDAVRAALLAWIDAELCDGPLGIFLEDLHWADAPSLALVEALLTANADRPLFVLGTSRPEFLSRSPAISSAAGARVIRLGPLTELAASTFVRSILDTGSNTSQFDDSVARASSGARVGIRFSSRSSSAPSRTVAPSSSSPTRRSACWRLGSTRCRSRRGARRASRASSARRSVRPGSRPSMPSLAPPARAPRTGAQSRFARPTPAPLDAIARSAGSGSGGPEPHSRFARPTPAPLDAIARSAGSGSGGPEPQSRFARPTPAPLDAIARSAGSGSGGPSPTPLRSTHAGSARCH